MAGPKPEILAPAGSSEALEAAVRCGADAVYLGAGRFNARRNAQNFSTAALREAVETCHARNVRVHLALNTLVRQEELPDAMAAAEEACALGVDALIIQDMGLARRIRAAAPSMPLHASTQLSCHTPAGVEELRDCGFTRVVLAREMSREEIAACAGRGCELEVFVHGALCMCVSGQCYLSAMLGGRSGNRGLCAQPCRLPVAPAEAGRAGDAAALSLKDLSLPGAVGELADAGGCSLKIEGRMKRPEYVAAAVSVFRAAADGEAVPQAALDDLRAVFSRSGFTDGYYRGRRGAEMFGVRGREDVTAAAAPVLSRLRRLYDREPGRVAADMVLEMEEGRPLRLEVTDREGNRAAAEGEAPQRAVSRPLTAERAAEQLSRTGGTYFLPGRIACSVGEGLAVSAAALNALRRQALEALDRARRAPRPVPFDKTAAPSPAEEAASPGKRLLWARYADVSQASPSDGADLRFVPLGTAAESLRRLAAEGETGVDIPRGLFGAEEDARRLLEEAARAGVRAALCGNIGALRLAREAGLRPVGGFGLNLCNREAVEAYALRGAAALTLSPELTFPQMTPLIGGPVPVGLLAYGRLPLMLMRNCPRRAAGGCAGCRAGPGGLIDRKGMVFPVQCAGGCAELLNAARLYWADKLDALPRVDFLLLHFTDETPEQAAAVLRDYRRGGTAPPGITRGLYRRGVE